MKQMDVRKRGDEWVAESAGRAVARAATKAEIVRRAAQAARGAASPVSVRIHGLNGRIQQERTYPRGADPQGSKG